MALNQCRVGDQIRRDILQGHVPKEFARSRHVTLANKEVDERVEGDLVADEAVLGLPIEVDRRLRLPSLHACLHASGEDRGGPREGLQLLLCVAEDGQSAAEVAAREAGLDHGCEDLLVLRGGQIPTAALHLAPELPGIVAAAGMAVGADQGRIGMQGRHNALCPKLLQDLRQAQRITEADASIEQAIDEHLVGDDLRAPDELNDPVDVRRAWVVPHALHQDGAREGVGPNACAVHGLHDRPCAIHVLARHRVADQGVVSHNVRREASLGHLPKRRARLRVRPRGEEYLEVGVVGDDVDTTLLRHALEEALRGGVLAACDAGLQRAVVRRGIHGERGPLELLKEMQSLGQVPLAAGRAD
mmetsp:Transcript_70938/g.205410  ORF Transcript_70938/g.205410 Transcript_70938/m.205410 type:complete len:359 (-) Transcript_70938:1174-2250(-)